VHSHHQLSQPIPSAANAAGKIPSVRHAVHFHHPPAAMEWSNLLLHDVIAANVLQLIVSGEENPPRIKQHRFVE